MRAAGRRPVKDQLARWARRAAGAVALLGTAVIVALVIAWHAMPFPMHRLESWPSSPRITDRDGRVLLTRSAGDGQWRLPVPRSAMRRGVKVKS